MENTEWLEQAERYWVNPIHWINSRSENDIRKDKIRRGIETCLHSTLKDERVFFDSLKEKLEGKRLSKDFIGALDSLTQEYDAFFQRCSYEKDAEVLGIEHPLLKLYNILKPLLPKPIKGLESRGRAVSESRIGAMTAMEMLPYTKLNFLTHNSPELVTHNYNPIGNAFNTRRFILLNYPEKPLDGEAELFVANQTLFLSIKSYEDWQREGPNLDRIEAEWFDLYREIFK